MKADEYEVDAHHERSYQDKMQRTKKGMVGGFVGTAIALAAAAFIAIAVPGATGPLRDQGGGQQPQTKPRQKVQEQPNVPERRTAAEQNMQRQQRQPEVTGPNQQNAAILDQRLTDGRTVWKALDSLGVDVLELKNRMIYADKNTLAKLVEDINAELRNAGLSIGSGNLPRKRIGALIPKDTLNLADGPRDVNWMARIAARNKQSRQGLRNLALQAHGIPRHQRALEARIA